MAKSDKFNYAGLAHLCKLFYLPWLEELLQGPYLQPQDYFVDHLDWRDFDVLFAVVLQRGSAPGFPKGDCQTGQ